MKITIQDARTSVTLQQRDFRVTISGARGPAGPAGPSEWGGIDGDIEDQTDLYNALQAKVPYTGATQDVNLGEYGAQLGNLEFDTTPTNVPTTAGSVYWNDTDGTLNLVLKGGQTISRIGETQHIRALNNTGAQIARGKVVYVVGAQGQRLTIGLADADTEILSKDTIGFTAEAIADGAEGFVIVQGVINNVSTTGMTDGATVYLSQTAGGYTTTAPTDPAHLVVLGFIVNGGSGGAGSIYVKVDNGYELEELHGVADAAKVTPVGADALLLRDSEDNNLWKRLTWTNALAGVKSHMDTFKSVAGGYASLDGSGKVPASELPSYVDDVVEVANYAALPGTGEAGKIYVTLDTNKCYRWTGSVYVEVSAGGGVDTLTTTGTSGAATLVGSTLNIPQYQGVLTNPVTGTGTAGQVAYWSGTTTQTGSSNLTWNGASNFLRINGGIGFNRDPFGGRAIDITGGGIRLTGSTNGSFEINGSNSSFTVNTVGGDIGLSFNDTSNARLRLTGNSYIYECQVNANRFTIRDITSGDIDRFTILNTGNTGIGINSPSARLHVRGSGTTSATTALLVQNSTPNTIMGCLDSRTTYFGSTSGYDGTVEVNLTGHASRLMKIGTIEITQGAGSDWTGQGIRVDGANRTFIFNVSNSNTSDLSAFTFNGGGISAGTGFSSRTSGTINWLLTNNAGFAPTSGSAVFNQFTLSGTINQTGGANGITRGLYVNPTLTAASDWRSIETSNNTGYAAYFAGSADLFLGNGADIQIGTTTGTKIGTATTQKIGMWNATPVAQPTTAIPEAAFVENSGGTSVNVDSTFAGYTIQQIAQALKDIGILA